jgi:hypothetical protein
VIGCWCSVVLNVHASTDDKSCDVEDSCYGELECVFSKLLKYHMIILI